MEAVTVTRALTVEGVVVQENEHGFVIANVQERDKEFVRAYLNKIADVKISLYPEPDRPNPFTVKAG